MVRNRLLVYLVGVGAALLLWACGSPPCGCTPGATQACLGIGACPGAQVCQADGNSWGACLCAAVGNCMDNVRNGSETSVDCGGGTCATCALGLPCIADADCASNACDGITLTCVSDPCADHRQDGMESDVDCGGIVCANCAVGKKCNNTGDCQPGHVCGGVSKVCQ